MDINEINEQVSQDIEAGAIDNCPCCGSKATVYASLSGRYTVCCGATNGYRCSLQVSGSSYEECKQQWNRRPVETTPPPSPLPAAAVRYYPDKSESELQMRHDFDIDCIVLYGNNIEEAEATIKENKKQLEEAVAALHKIDHDLAILRGDK